MTSLRSFLLGGMHRRSNPAGARVPLPDFEALSQRFMNPETRPVQDLPDDPQEALESLVAAGALPEGWLDGSLKFLRTRLDTESSPEQMRTRRNLEGQTSAEVEARMRLDKARRERLLSPVYSDLPDVLDLQRYAAVSPALERALTLAKEAATRANLWGCNVATRPIVATWPAEVTPAGGWTMGSWNFGSHWMLPMQIAQTEAGFSNDYMGLLDRRVDAQVRNPTRWERALSLDHDVTWTSRQTPSGTMFVPDSPHKLAPLSWGWVVADGNDQLEAWWHALAFPIEKSFMWKVLAADGRVFPKWASNTGMLGTPPALIGKPFTVGNDPFAPLASILELGFGWCVWSNPVGRAAHPNPLVVLVPRAPRRVRPARS